MWCHLFIKAYEWWSVARGGCDVACGAITGLMWACWIHCTVFWVKIGCLIRPEITAFVSNLWGPHTRCCTVETPVIYLSLRPWLKRYSRSSLMFWIFSWRDEDDSHLAHIMSSLQFLLKKAHSEMTRVQEEKPQHLAWMSDISSV